MDASKRGLSNSKQKNQFESGLNDPFFATRLENLEKLRYSKLMNSKEQRSKQTRRESLYDYQKIQSTSQGSQFLGQRHFMLGGPSSGYH